MSKTLIESIKTKYRSAAEHLRAIEDAVLKQFALSEDQRDQVRKAVEAAYSVGRETTTTDDWCDYF